MTDVVLSSGVKSNLLNLQRTSSLLEVRQKNLSTGLRVNSALDNPTNFFTAASLNSRANDLNRLLDGVSNATQSIKAADSGITAIKKLVENAQATARQALTSSLGEVSHNASVTGTAFTHSAEARSTTDGIEILSSLPNYTASETGTAFTNTAESRATTDDIAIDSTTVGTDLNGQTVSFTVNTADGTAQTVSVAFGASEFTDGTSTAADVVASLNANTDFDGAGLEAADDGSGNLVIRSQDSTDYKTSFTVASGPAAFTGATVTDPSNLLSQNSISDGDTLTFDVGGTVQTITFGVGTDKVATFSELQAALGNIGDGITASITSGNEIELEFESPTVSGFTIGGTAATSLGLTAGLVEDQDVETTVADFNNTSISFTVDGADGTQETFSVAFGAGQFTAGSDDVNTVAAAFNDDGNFNEFLEATVDTNGDLVIQAKDPTDYKTSFSINSGLSVFTAATISEPVNLLTDNNISDGETLEITVGDGETQTITFGVGDGKVATFEELQAALNTIGGVTASTDSVTKKISIVLDNLTESQFTVGGAAAGKVGLTVGTTKDIDGPDVANASSSRSSFQSEFNAILKQIDELAADASYNGNNLLNGDSVKVIFNEDGDHSLTLSGVIFDSAGLGISQVTGDGFQINSSIEETLSELDDATQKLRDQGSKFGSQLSTVETREEFIKDLSNVLTVGADNLVVADANEQGAELLALQTRQTLSTTTLSLATQSEQNVLRLF